MSKYWDDRLKEVESHQVRIDGVCYWIGPEPERPGSVHGFGGRKFVIQFDDGRRIVTHNLWHNGTIPPDYKKVMPDNAVFVDEN